MEQTKIKEFARKFFEENNLSNFDSISDNARLLHHFFLGVSWITQFDALKLLYMQKFIPESEKADKAANIELSKSEAAGYLNITSEIKYEIIRFGYVALYHKYESFAKSLNETLKKNYNSDIDIISVIKNHFDYDFSKPDKGIGYKVSWISNCVKHQDSIASERNKAPNEFINYPQGQQLKIESSDFEADCNSMRILVSRVLIATSVVVVIDDYSQSNLDMYKPLFDQMKKI